MTPAGLAKRVEAARIASRWLLSHACNGFKGRGELDPFYQIVTEHRDVGPMQQKYSSCGDLAHWLYWSLGVRLKFVNREQRKREGGTYGWLQGANTWKLTQLGNDLGTNDPAPDAPFASGDVLLIWSKPDTTDAHVICVTAPYANKVLPTAEYGQPGGMMYGRALTPNGLGGFRIGSRQAHVWLPLDKVLEAADAVHTLQPIDMVRLADIAPAEVCAEVQALCAESEGA